MSNKTVILVGIGSMGSIPTILKRHLGSLELTYNLDVLQNSELLGRYAYCVKYYLREIVIVS